MLLPRVECGGFMPLPPWMAWLSSIWLNMPRIPLVRVVLLALFVFVLSSKASQTLRVLISVNYFYSISEFDA
jgi:hypothetical protein